MHYRTVKSWTTRGLVTLVMLRGATIAFSADLPPPTFFFWAVLICSMILIVIDIRERPTWSGLEKDFDHWRHPDQKEK